jgi:small-conductance mechanosensitive channel
MQYIAVYRSKILFILVEDLLNHIIIIAPKFMSQETNIESIENNNSEPSKVGKFVTAAYNIIGFVVGFFALFTQDNRNWLTILLMYPLLGIVIVLFGKGAVKLFLMIKAGCMVTQYWDSLLHQFF